MNTLRNVHLLGTTTPVQGIISALRNIVVDRLTGSNKDYSTTLLNIVNTLRTHPEEFQEWHTSPQQHYSHRPPLRTKKKIKGIGFEKF